MAGKLIVFEGTDGSGKSTQFKLLCDRLKQEGIDFNKIIFPQYSEPSSALLRMYLNGDFGRDPMDVNAYAASAFFAVDRFASYRLKWKKYYENGGIMLSDRYTTSNAVHQASKIEPSLRNEFFAWLSDFEYRLFELPEPNVVIYLDMPTETAIKLLREREAEERAKGDIHEIDVDYLKKCSETAKEAARFYGWRRIDCAPGGKLRTVDDIQAEIAEIVFSELGR